MDSIGIAGLLFTTAVLIIWQHHRAHVRTERYESLPNSVMVQLELLATAQAPYTTADAARVLDSLVETVGYERSAGLFSATILKRLVKPGEPFKLYAQDKQNKFQQQFAVHETNSVAGKVVETDETSPRALMYVPSTKYIHGIVIKREKGANDQEIFKQMEIVPALIPMLRLLRTRTFSIACSPSRFPCNNLGKKRQIPTRLPSCA